MVGEPRGRVEHSVQRAISVLEANGNSSHKHSEKCMRLIKHIITPGEETILECKQSYFHSISPARVIATTRRIIIVRPSFWGLYLNKDIISPTEYNIIPYKHLISVIMSRGKLLSTIHMRIHGFTDATSSMKDEGEIYGIKTKEALRLANFLEEIIEYREGGDEFYEEEDAAKKQEPGRFEISGVRYVDLEQARQIVQLKNSSFVWLGIEPPEAVAAMLGVEKEKIVKTGTSKITELKQEELLHMGNAVFVCYQGGMSSHLASFLKKQHNVDVYVLRGGIQAVVHQSFNQRR